MSKRQHTEAEGPSQADLSKRVAELSIARLRELVLAAADGNAEFALEVMAEKEAACLSEERLDAKWLQLCEEAETIWHSLDRLRPSQQFSMAGQITERFEKNILQPVGELAPDDELHILTELADAAATPDSFEGEIWKNAIGGCGGGVIGSLAERMEEIFAACKSQRVAACKPVWEDIAERLDDYGMYEFDKLIEMAGGKTEKTFGKGKGGGLVFGARWSGGGGKGKGGGGYSVSRGRGGGR